MTETVMVVNFSLNAVAKCYLVLPLMDMNWCLRFFSY